MRIEEKYQPDKPKITFEPSQKVTGSYCLGCRKFLDGVTGVSGAKLPKPGSISVCVYCGHIQKYAKDLSFEPVSDAELAEIKASECWTAIAATQAFARSRGMKNEP